MRKIYNLDANTICKEALIMFAKLRLDGPRVKDGVSFEPTQRHISFKCATTDLKISLDEFSERYLQQPIRKFVYCFGGSVQFRETTIPLPDTIKGITGATLLYRGIPMRCLVSECDEESDAGKVIVRLDVWLADPLVSDASKLVAA